MADLSKIKVVDCELSVRTRNALKSYFGPTATLADIDAAPDDLLGRLLSRKSRVEIREMITSARSWAEPEWVAVGTVTLRHRTGARITFPDGAVIQVNEEALKLAEKMSELFR